MCFLERILTSSLFEVLLSNSKNCNQQTNKNNLLPDTLHDPAPHVMVLTPQTSVFTMLRQSGTEKVVVGLGPTKQYQQTLF